MGDGRWAMGDGRCVVGGSADVWTSPSSRFTKGLDTGERSLASWARSAPDVRRSRTRRGSSGDKGGVMASIRSTWATSPITVEGALTSAEWSGAAKLELSQGSSHFGTLMVKNDATYLYIALDVSKDLGSDPGTGDYFWFIIDADRNRAITPNVDVMYSLYPGEPNHLGRWYFLGPGTWKPTSS